MKMPAAFFRRNTFPASLRVQLLLVLLAFSGLTACAVSGSGQTVQILSAQGGRIDLLEEARSPVLVVQSEKGIGRAKLYISQALPEELTFEFPGLKKLEHFSLTQSGRALVCAGTDETETVCSWGNEWPVARMKHYPRGMTVTVPAKVFATPGEWRLEWVNYYRK
jgi:hypothetical protein